MLRTTIPRGVTCPVSWVAGHRRPCIKLYSSRSLARPRPKFVPGWGNYHSGSPQYARNPTSTVRWASSAIDTSSKAVLDDIDPFYLRDSCTCPRCVDGSTTQKLFETSEIPTNLTYKHHEWMRNGQLRVTWNNDIQGYEDHQSVYEPEFLENAQSFEQRRAASHNIWKPIAWSKQDIEQNIKQLTFSFKDYVNDNEIFLQAVENLHVYGLIFVKDVPTDEHKIEELANRIGPLKNTFYGMTWNVKSVPSAKNVAYTSTNLDFHMDLLYFADPPGIQFLHVLKQSTAGGESRFSDAVAAFEKLQEEDPELARALVDFPVTYHYKNDGHWLQQTRYFLEGGATGRGKPSGSRLTYPIDYESINWSPPFQGPMERVDVLSRTADSTGPGFEEYIRAAKRFKELVATESAVYETKMGEGICAIFNNRRILHARKPFSSAGGERWLKGCYVDWDYLRDKYRYMKDLKSRRTQPSSHHGLA